MKLPACVNCGGPIKMLSEGHYLKGTWEHVFAAHCVAFCRKPGFSRHAGGVSITLTENQWDFLLIAINVGNPDFVPYDVEPEAAPND